MNLAPAGAAVPAVQRCNAQAAWLTAAQVTPGSLQADAVLADQPWQLNPAHM